MTKPFRSADFPDVFHFLTTRICKTSCKRRPILPMVGMLTSWMIYCLDFLIASGLTTDPVWSPAEHSISDLERWNTARPAGREQRCRAQLMAGDSWSEDYFDQRTYLFPGAFSCCKAFAAPWTERRTCSKMGWDLLQLFSLTRSTESGLGQIFLSRSDAGGRQERYFPTTMPSLCKGLFLHVGLRPEEWRPCPGFLGWCTLL